MEDPQDFVDKTMEELDEYFAASEENDDEQVDQQQPVEDDDGGEEELGSQAGEDDKPDEDAGDQEEDSVTLPDGTVTTLAEIQRVVAFERYLNDHPDVAARVVEAARGPAPTGPAAEQPPTSLPHTPSIPEFVDVDDPTTKWFVDRLQQLETENLRIQAEEAQRRLQAANYAAEQALLSVKDRLDLTDPEVTKLRDYTASLNIVPGIMTRHPDNQIAGFTEALEMAAYSLPDIREKMIAKQVEARNKVVKADRARTNKLGKLSNKSGGGGLPPQRKEPQTEDERREAMIQDIAESMGVSR